MIQLGEILISEDIFETKFVCDLQACKGACCVEGEGGAPLTLEEVEILENILPDIEPFLDPKGLKEIQEKGVAVTGYDGELETPLLNGKECAYLVYDEKGMALCGIEMAHKAGKTDFKKPISCHLYPIREKELRIGSAMNYHRWGICSDACTLGEKLGIPLFRFAKDPLVRKYGEDWYKELEEVYEVLVREGRINP